MSIKLGDLLVKHRIITEAQLNEALRAQQLFGGRLGTNLVELGYLSEQGLTKFLSAQLHISAVAIGELDSIPEDALAALPRATTEKYQVVPLGVSGRRLRIAMADPTDLKAVDDISFATGFSIQPYVAPELLIIYALEKYYGITRPMRYLMLDGMSEPEFEVVQPSEPSQPPVSALDGPVHVEQRGEFLKQERKDLLQGPYDLKQASKDLAAATHSKDVFEALRRLLAQHFERAIILIARGNRLMGWDAVGASISPKDLRRVSLARNENALLGQALQCRTAFIGTLPPASSGDWVASVLQAKQDRAALALSIAVNNQPVSVLAARGPRKGELADHLSLYDALAAKMSHSFQMVYLLKRILD